MAEEVVVEKTVVKAPDAKAVEKKVEVSAKDAVIEKSLADYDDESAAGDDKKAEEKPSYNFKRFQELDPEYDSEDKLFGAVKNLKEEKTRLQIAAKGSKAIDEDAEIKSLRGWTKKSNEELFVGALVTEYMESDMDEPTAFKKAQEKLAAAKEKDPEAIELTALRTRKSLKALIKEKEDGIMAQVENARKEEKPETDDDLFEQVRGKVNTIEDFLGMKLGDTPDAKKKIYGKVEAALTKTQRAKLLKDPEFLADAFFFHTNKKQLTKAISERGTGRASMLDKLDKAPAVSPPTPIRHLGDKQPSTDKFGKDFKSNFK